MHDLSVLDVRSEGMDVLDLENIPEKPVFEFLQRLYLKGRLSKLPIWVSSLHSLIKIHLEWSRMDASPLEALQDLPNLLELQMVDSYTGDCLEFRAGTFGKLRLLVIEQFCQLKAILVLERAMPQLHTLKIIKCESMRILPIGIECLSCLEELILHGVNEELKDKVRQEEPLAIQHIKVIKT
ncbi:hypothetical protein SAY87_003149 [Trapa incisa]|uniref:Disease resistance R13L4/SHOC-2-like LRR domain-containing protein n=1 Tax=Trapa incisa TaxID=236973 RepID=A0AAN7KNN0_9MYRT|nr:hypothetical protein SAY87_003149 [Trapa incisa]